MRLSVCALFYQAESRSKTEKIQNKVEKKMDNNITSHKKNEMGQHFAVKEQVHIESPSGVFDHHSFV